MNTSENLVLRLSLCALLFVAAKVAGERANPRDPASMAEPVTVWDKNRIQVCWGRFSDLSRTAIQADQMAVLKKERFTTLPNEDRAQIQSIVQSEYTIERTGIEFVGWQNCASGDGSDAIIVTAADRPEDWDSPRPTLSGATTIGHGGVLFETRRGRGGPIVESGFRAGPGKKPTYVFLSISRYDPTQKLKPIEALQMTALHEFGHLAGLRHEHARQVDAYRDVNCRQMGTPLAQPEMGTRALTGLYDGNSIMSYCFLHSIKYRTGLAFKTKKTYTIADIPEMRRRRILGVGAIDIHDPSISQVTRLDDEYMDYRVRIGLSAGDVHALRCLYVYDVAAQNKYCVPNYDPVAAFVAAKARAEGAPVN